MRRSRRRGARGQPVLRALCCPGGLPGSLARRSALGVVGEALISSLHLPSNVPLASPQ